jgi:hypothetical protein
MPLELDLAEQDAIIRLLKDRVATSALKKFLAYYEQHNTVQARNHQNMIPESLDLQARNRALASQYAAMAKAWGEIWGKLEMSVRAE